LIGRTAQSKARGVIAGLVLVAMITVARLRADACRSQRRLNQDYALATKKESHRQIVSTEAAMPTMLILRGNSGSYENEEGKAHYYDKGALHEGPAKDLATRRGFTPQVLDVSGDAKPPGKDAPVGKDGKRHGTRHDSPQTIKALRAFRDDKSITGFYGFSGGGYNLWQILKQMTPDERRRVDLVVVVGVDTDKPESEYDKSKFTGGDWELIYRPNHPKNHMFEPEALLLDTPAGVGRYRDVPIQVRDH
jgi:hypothetical protein